MSKHNLNELAKDIHDIATSKGFYDNDNQNIPEKLMLIVSEVSEALEEIRKDTNKDFIKFGEELADVIIRTLDLASYLKIDIDKQISDKIEKNKLRPYKHGKKF